MTGLPRKSSKRIGYIEPVFDLMFVYLIQRNNELLEPSDPFFTGSAYMVYLISTLVILQIWATSTLYINRFGSGEVADYVLLFVNLYLLYYIGINTRMDWIDRYALYHIVWVLILLNFMLHFIRLLMRPANRQGAYGRMLRARIVLFSVQAGVVLLTIPWSASVQRIAAWLPLAVGFIGPVCMRKVDAEMPLDFPHLAERVESMVFIAFGEVIVSVAGFFDDQIQLREIYFSLCAFLVVVGLLLSYGYMYLHMIDRHHCTRGYLFVFLHLFVIIALSNISISFHFALDPDCSLWDNHVFRLVSMLAYYFMLCLVTRVAGKAGARTTWFPASAAPLSVAFAVSVFVWYENEWAMAAASVLYSFSMLACFVHHWNRKKSTISRLSQRETPTLPS